MAEQQPPRRSTLPKDEAQRRYIEIGELVVLEQIKRDADWLDDHPIAIGPFARLDAGAAAAHDGKTRGVISNLFGSQAAFQAETMALALSAADWIDRIQYPEPAAFPDAEAWVDALLADESARGPRHAADPVIDFGTLWALWLGVVPYGDVERQGGRAEHGRAPPGRRAARTGARPGDRPFWARAAR